MARGYSDRHAGHAELFKSKGGVTRQNQSGTKRSAGPGGRATKQGVGGNPKPYNPIALGRVGSRSHPTPDKVGHIAGCGSRKS